MNKQMRPMPQGQPQRDVAVWRNEVVRNVRDNPAYQLSLLSLLRTPEAVERFVQVALHATIYNSAITDCDPLSVVEAIREAAVLGLEPTGLLGEAAIIPYKGKAALRPMYRGYIKLAYNSGKVKIIDCQIVYMADRFEIELGTSPSIKHVPALYGERDAAGEQVASRGDYRGAYAWAKLTTGDVVVEWMSVDDIEKIRRSSDSVKNGRPSPWDNWYGEMARKSVIRRLLKRLQLTPESQQAIAIDVDDDWDSGGVKESRTSSNTRAIAALSAIKTAKATPNTPRAADAVETPSPVVEQPVAPPTPARTGQQSIVCDATKGDTWCVRETGHPGMHRNSTVGSWSDGD